jgi:SAM-dependent methyltransferase
MAGDAAPVPAWQAMTDDQIRRWEELLDNLARMLPTESATVVIDGPHPHATIVADRLAGALRAAGRPTTQLHSTPAAEDQAPSPDQATVTVAGHHWRTHPPHGRCDLVIWLRTPPGEHPAGQDGEYDADIVVDLHDPTWPVIRRGTARVADHYHWYITEGRAFFAARAATWDTKFGDDLPAYAQAVAEAALPRGGIVLDVGCGTGRALAALRDAVGPDCTVIGLDLTSQMLAVAAPRAAATHATLLLGDARKLPLATASLDVVFAAGLMTHLPDTHTGLRELARITRPGGKLVLFHPSGRAALAARHGRTLRADEPLAETRLRDAAHAAGWHIDTYDDPPHRFYATATRRSPHTTARTHPTR